VVDHFKVPYGIAVNKWDINRKISRKIENFAKKKFLGKISYDKKIFEAISNLVPILETNLKAKKEIENVFNEVNRAAEKYF